MSKFLSKENSLMLLRVSEWYLLLSPGRESVEREGFCKPDLNMFILISGINLMFTEIRYYSKLYMLEGAFL